MRRIIVFAFLAAMLQGSSLVRDLWAERFVIDPVHSDVSFAVRHMVVSKVRGNFSKFSGEFQYEDKKPETWKATALIETASVNTNNEKRDEHLRGTDFFDVAKYSSMTFTGSKTEMKDGKYKLFGMLTLHGVEKPVALDLVPGGTIKDMRGNLLAGFEASTTINRKDFGITYNKTLDTGGLALGEEVEISIHVEGVSEKKEEKSKEKKGEK